MWGRKEKGAIFLRFAGRRYPANPADCVWIERETPQTKIDAEFVDPFPPDSAIRSTTRHPFYQRDMALRFDRQKKPYR